MKTTLETTVGAIEPLDEQAMAMAARRQDSLTKPRGSLGRLEKLSIHLAGIQATVATRARDKLIITFAADHGVVREGVSLYPPEVTAQMVYNFLAGGAGINVLCGQAGARVVVADLGVAADLNRTTPSAPGASFVSAKVAPGTRNMARGPAMTRAEALRSLEAGIGVVESELARGLDILGVGEMGIGNTTAASAITAAITGLEPGQVAGRGTGLDDAGLEKKVGVIRQALAVNRPDAEDPIDVLSKVGGFEIGGMAGAMLAAARHRIPVLIDGFISGAAALIACRIAPMARRYMIASHQSVEIGHARILEFLELEPIFNLDLRLGEGTGAALGIMLVEAASRILNGMATFEQAGVSDKPGEA